MYRWLEHTSEQEIWIEADSPEDVLGEAAAALGDLLQGDRHGDRVTRRVSAGARDLPALLVAWLEELVFLAEIDGFIPERVIRMDLVDDAIGAVVAGRHAEAQSLVKAVTYHQLEFAQEDDGSWHARVILDV